MRVLAGTVVLAVVSAASAREISFEARVAALEEIERLSEREVPREVLERRVRQTLAQSSALASYWKTPITAEDLRNEMERIAASTRFPERLVAIYDALGNDPVLVQETLARATLADRWARGHRDTGSWDEFWPTDVPVVADDRPLPRRLSTLTASCQGSDSWDNGALGAVPEGRGGASAVWSGRVMIVWGGSREGRPLATGGRYDPLADTWKPTSTVDAPAARWGHSAVWTGSALIVWGGSLAAGGVTATGGRYDPVSDTWMPISSVGAPAARQDHTAVWTGTRMLVWGGAASDITGTHYPADGASYDPASDTWSPISAAGAPLGRRNHTAVWTGGAMIVWGGDRTDVSVTSTLDTGGRYDPASDTWTPTAAAGAPSGRTYHRAVWTGTSMVVWGGQFYPAPGSRQYVGTGARYDPAADSWTPMATAGAPSGRISHGIVADGGLVLVWGGQGAGGWSGTGGRYDAVANAWTPMSSAGAPSARGTSAAVWTGSKLVVWSGASLGGTFPDSGGRYDPALDQWAPTFSQNAPVPREHASVVWTGSQMIVWGGLRGEEPVATGGRYDPLTDSWTPTAVSPLNRARVFHTAVWTGSRMLLWGGEPCPNVYDRGTSYDPVADTWTELDHLTEPAPRRHHTAVWTGNRMVVWGGLLCTGPPVVTATGSRFDPASNTWSALATSGAPTARQLHTAVWTGSRMIVWGGSDEGSPPTAVNTGGRYDPVADSWSSTRKPGAPAARRDHSAVWTGNSMIVWGGTGSADLDTGARYDPAGDAWTATSTAGAPAPRVGHTAVWAGNVMVVWGGDTSAIGNLDALATGGRYDPGIDTWVPTSTSKAPSARTQHSAVWSGSFMIVWGGASGYAPDTGGRYVVLNPDGDLDGVADACDCAPGDAGTFSIPGEVGALGFGSDKTTIAWASAVDGGGTSTVHDGIVGDLSAFPVVGSACMGPGTAATSVVDASVPPPGTGRWYLVRGRNACGAGTYGVASGGAERISSVCP